MIDVNDFEGMGPYTDEEAREAIAALARHPAVPMISKYLFRDQPATTLRKLLLSIHTVEEFQQTVMRGAVQWVLDTTTNGLSYEGVEYLKDLGDRKFVVMSNHRDIVLDPAFTQYVLLYNDIPLTQIAVGDNLLSSKTIERLFRLNRMIKVIRGISSRELYNSSLRLSNYIRHSVTSGESSVWIAQRQGRTKDGLDVTEHGLLKMLDMSGTGTFQENFEALSLVPATISYEYEPCDAKKAREMLISRTEKYVKKEDEDMHSILTGIRQRKGHVHLSFDKPLSSEDIARIAALDRAERYPALMALIDGRIQSGFHLWGTNYIAYDRVFGTTKYADRYTPEEAEAFASYTEHKLERIEKSLNREDLRDIFLRIYAHPVLSRERLL